MEGRRWGIRAGFDPWRDIGKIPRNKDVVAGNAGECRVTALTGKAKTRVHLVF
jgi:hypothetical protein